MEERWIKVYSFDSQYQAEMTKDILEQNDVKAVIINAKDSLFLIGEYELYVNVGDEKKANAIIDEYKGLTKVDSFVMRGPVERFKDELEADGIASVIKINRNPRYVLDNYELYVENQDVKRVLPYITGEALKGWKCIKTCIRTAQTRYRIEILNQSHIPSIVIKKRDAKFMKSEINIYVKDEDADNARKVLTDLEGWEKVATFSDLETAELNEKTLGRNSIKSLVEYVGAGNYLLYVENKDKENAISIINGNKSWKLLASFTDEVEADYAAALLENSGIQACPVFRNEINLMIDIDLYVEEFQLDKANEILKNIINIENE